jgi:hypothetical protein
MENVLIALMLVPPLLAAAISGASLFAGERRASPRLAGYGF